MSASIPITSVVPVVCSWCGLTWAKPGYLPGGGVSHSICDPCFESKYPNVAAVAKENACAGR